MQGKQVTAYVGGELKPEHKFPVSSDKIVKSWAPTQSKAEAEKRRMEREHGGIVRIE